MYCLFSSVKNRETRDLLFYIHSMEDEVVIYVCISSLIIINFFCLFVGTLDKIIDVENFVYVLLIYHYKKFFLRQW